MTLNPESRPESPEIETGVDSPEIGERNVCERIVRVGLAIQRFQCDISKGNHWSMILESVGMEIENPDDMDKGGYQLAMSFDPKTERTEFVLFQGYPLNKFGLDPEGVMSLARDLNEAQIRISRKDRISQEGNSNREDIASLHSLQKLVEKAFVRSGLDWIERNPQ